MDLEKIPWKHRAKWEEEGEKGLGWRCDEPSGDPSTLCGQSAQLGCAGPDGMKDGSDWMCPGAGWKRYC
jgi:hypothetical protein